MHSLSGEDSPTLRPTAPSYSGASFVFVGGVAEGAQSMLAPASTFPLANAGVGDRLTVVVINCGTSNARLACKGLSTGEQLTVLSHASSGSVIVQTPCQNIGLSAALAQNIYVELSHDEPVG